VRPWRTEIDALLNQADQRLKSAKQTAGASLRTLPVVFLLGEPNSAKTSTMLHSGLDPELLAGVVYRETGDRPHQHSKYLVLRAEPCLLKSAARSSVTPVCGRGF